MKAMAEISFHLRQHPLPAPHALFLLRTPNPLCHFHCRTDSISSRPFLLLSSRSLHTLRSRQWDPNAESFNFDADDESVEQWAEEVLEDYIDSIWIFKVFRSFGWMLPAIIISMLLTTGPKAFLLALALPVGQSTFAFAIHRFQNRGKIKPKPKTKTKATRGRSRPYSSRNAKFKVTAEQSVRQAARKKKKGYQSWASENSVPVSNNSRSASSYGGWDELDEVVESNVGIARKAPGKARPLERTSVEKGKSGKWSASEGPLLLRLLISAFPFLRSLTEFLL